jgi:hypothetical protein
MLRMAVSSGRKLGNVRDGNENNKKKSSTAFM